MADRVSFSLLRHSEIHKTQSSLRWYNLIYSQHTSLESSSEFLNRVNIVREKIEVVEDVCASPAEPWKELTHEFRPRLRWTKLFEMNPLSVKTTELESDTHWRSLKFPCENYESSIFTSIFPFLSGCNSVLCSWWFWWFWWWRDSRVYWVWKINCW